MRHLLRNWNFWRKNLSIYNHYSIILKDSRISRFLESNFQTTDNSSLDIRVSQKWNLLEPNAWSNKRVTLLPSIHRWKTTVKQPLDELICVRHATGAVQQSDKEDFKVTIPRQFVGSYPIVEPWMGEIERKLFTRHERIVCTLVSSRNENWWSEILMGRAIMETMAERKTKRSSLLNRASSSFSDRFQLWASRA